MRGASQHHARRRTRPCLFLALAGLLSGCFPLGFTDRFPDEDCEIGDCLPDVGVVVEPDVSYTFVHIVDDSEADVHDGYAGVEICGVVADCGDGPSIGISAELTLGDGIVCDGTTREPPCQAGIDRQSAEAALDDGRQCNPRDNDEPPSDSVSLGIAGRLTVEFPVDLRGCNITLTGRVDPGPEDYELYELLVCAGARADARCLREGMSLTRGNAHGEISVEVPEQ